MSVWANTRIRELLARVEALEKLNAARLNPDNCGYCGGKLVFHSVPAGPLLDMEKIAASCTVCHR